MNLTATQEDYIEAIYRRQKERGGQGLRVTDLAQELGCRLPTVTRTIASLVEKGYLSHESRGLVHLTTKGDLMAQELAHRHDDLEAFLELMLGLPHDAAELDACRLEHSLSRLTAERLHALMNYVETLPSVDRQRLRQAVSKGAGQESPFAHLVDIKTPGWRW